MTAFAMETEFPGIHVFGIMPEQATEYWPQVEPFAAMALEHAVDGMTTADVLDRIVDGSLVLIVVTDDIGKAIASMTLEVVDQPRGRICHCMTLGGIDLEIWVHEYIGVWKQIARELDCDYITIKGRAGWEKYARKFGFEHQYTIMTLPIEG
jgi:hypothetical protein